MKHAIGAAASDDATAARLATYRDLLLRWNATINLVSARTAMDIDARHIADSLQLLPLLPAQGALADLGSGGGLPGLVIAAALPGREVHLVESDRRKAAFLIDAAGRMGLAHVRVHPQRIEQARLPAVAAVTARALAPLTMLIGYAARILAPDGTAILPKGRTAEQELTTAATDWHFTTERFISRTDPEATILRLSHIRRASA